MRILNHHLRVSMGKGVGTHCLCLKVTTRSPKTRREHTYDSARRRASPVCLPSKISGPQLSLL
ncbi:hypothetical protein BD777DRAFT_127400 [Yarrowia lipolytica]|nr:hypothetical protein BD777DRAFT_127400 [Yarrowia lipolytica]